MDLLLEGHDRVREFNKTMVEELSLHCRTAIVERAFKAAEAVCRINNRGSGVLICAKARTKRPRGHQVAPQLGVILTTAYCLPGPDAAQGVDAIFDVPDPGRGSRDWGRIKCRLLPEYLYYSSVGARESVSAYTIGYALVACELVGVGAKLSVPAQPLPLPLVREDRGILQVGDTCLIIQHPNGKDGRKYHLTSCAHIEKNHYIHETRAAPSYDSSGGAVFSEAGEFVGLGHMAEGVHITINIHGILRHMIHYRQLQGLDMELADENPDLLDKFVDPDPDALPSDGPNRYAYGAQRGVYWKSVWDAWYDPEKYGTIILMLYAFPYHRHLALTALAELTAHQQRYNVDKISTYDGIEAIMGVMECCAEECEVVCRAVSALGTASGYADNLLSIHRANALPLVVDAIKRYGKEKVVAQWGSFVLLNLFTELDEAELAKGAFVALDGLRILHDAVALHYSDTYVARWGFAALATVGAYNEEFLTGTFACRIHVLLHSFMCTASEEVLKDDKSMEALLAALAQLLDDVSLAIVQRAAEELFHDGIVATLHNILQYWAEHHSRTSPEDVLFYACTAVHRIATAHPPSLPAAIALNMENALYLATVACPSSTRVLKAAMAATRALGCEVEDRYEHRTAEP